MRKTFLLTSILLLSAAWALAQYSSGSNATDQNSTGSHSSGASSGSSSGSQNTMDQNAPADQSEPQSSGGSTRSQTSSGASEDQGTTGQSMSSQQGETSSDMSGMHKAPAGGTTSRTMTFEGCLSESNGKFELTDKMGTRYELTGKTANLKAHVGHTIAVTGKASTSGENQPGAMSGEQGGMEQTLNVSSFRHVSSKCKSSTGSSTGGSNY